MLQPNNSAVWTYHASYTRNARAVGLGWAVCVICFTVIAFVAYGQPRWIANYDHLSPDGQVGYFGLYRRCTAGWSDAAYTCVGAYADLGSVLNSPFKIATVLQGIGLVLMLISICCLLLFFLIKASSAYTVCGILQVMAGACLLAGCIVFPAGWDDDDVRKVCGQDAAAYNAGECKIRWAYSLAIVCVFDALFLAILAFVLATRQPKKPDEKGGFLTQAEMDDYATEVESKASIAIQPVISVPTKPYLENSRAHRRGPPSRVAHSEYSYASTRPSRRDFHL